MSQSTDFELKDIVLSNSSFGPNEIAFITRRISDDFSQFSTLKDLTFQLEQDENRTPAATVRLGVCFYLLGRYSMAVETLRNADSGALAYFYMGKAFISLGQFNEALESFESAQKAGYDSDLCKLAIAETKRLEGNADSSIEILDNMFGPIEQTSEYLYQRGATVAKIGNNPAEVIALYQRAVESDERHAGALFGLALENDRRGNDEKALDLYQRAAACFPSNVGALLNLGLLYEDYEQYDRAKRCYDRILDEYPTHPQAQLFRKDSLASMDEHYDHNEEREHEQMAQILKTPVAQFELSVRSRNCLQKMGLITIGDLTRVTEQELLASKNFGETSLVEIREILGHKSLSIGQFAHEKATMEEPIDTSHLSPDEQALLDRPISELNLSVRARKCMTRLGLNTIGELIRKTGDDMLESKNFGVTSLNEVREKLTQVGLKLRGD